MADFKKELVVSLARFHFDEAHNFFVTCQLVSSRATNPKLRTEVSVNTQEPKFKRNTFAFRLPDGGADHTLAIKLEIFAVFLNDDTKKQGDKAKGSARAIGAASYRLSRAMDRALLWGPVNEELSFFATPDDSEKEQLPISNPADLVVGSVHVGMRLNVGNEAPTPTALPDPGARPRMVLLNVNAVFNLNKSGGQDPSPFVTAKTTTDAKLKRPAKAATHVAKFVRHAVWNELLFVQCPEDEYEDGESLLLSLVNNNSKKLIHKFPIPIKKLLCMSQYWLKLVMDLDDVSAVGRKTSSSRKIPHITDRGGSADSNIVLYCTLDVQPNPSRSLAIFRCFPELSRLRVIMKGFERPLGHAHDEIMVQLRLEDDGELYREQLSVAISNNGEGLPSIPFQTVYVSDIASGIAKLPSARNPSQLSSPVGPTDIPVWNQVFCFVKNHADVLQEKSCLVAEFFHRNFPSQATESMDTVIPDPDSEATFFGFSIVPLEGLGQLPLQNDGQTLSLDQVPVFLVYKDHSERLYMQSQDTPTVSLELNLQSADVHCSYLESIVERGADYPEQRVCRPVGGETRYRSIGSLAQDPVSPSPKTTHFNRSVYSPRDRGNSIIMDASRPITADEAGFVTQGIEHPSPDEIAAVASTPAQGRSQASLPPAEPQSARSSKSDRGTVPTSARSAVPTISQDAGDVQIHPGSASPSQPVSSRSGEASARSPHARPQAMSAEPSRPVSQNAPPSPPMHPTPEPSLQRSRRTSAKTRADGPFPPGGALVKMTSQATSMTGVKQTPLDQLSPPVSPQRDESRNPERAFASTGIRNDKRPPPIARAQKPSGTSLLRDYQVGGFAAPEAGFAVAGAGSVATSADDSQPAPPQPPQPQTPQDPSAPLVPEPLVARQLADKFGSVSDQLSSLHMELERKQALIDSLTVQVNQRAAALVTASEDIARIRSENEALKLESKTRAKALLKQDKFMRELADDAGIEDMDHEALMFRFQLLSRKFREFASESELVESQLEAAKAELDKKQTIEKEYLALQDAHTEQALFIQKLQDENREVEKYRTTAKNQEAIIAKMEKHMETTLRDAKKVRLLEEELKLRDAGYDIHRDTGSGDAKSELRKAFERIRELESVIETRSTSLNQEQQIMELQVRVEAAENRASAAEAEMLDVSNRCAREVSGMKIKLAEKDAQLAGGFGSQTNLVLDELAPVRQLSRGGTPKGRKNPPRISLKTDFRRSGSLPSGRLNSS